MIFSPIEWFTSLPRSAQVGLQLEFSNAATLVLMAACALIFADNVFATARAQRSAKVVGQLIFGVLVVFTAFAWRAYLVWNWRNAGALYTEFPRIAFFCIETFLLVPGCALVMRAGARRAPLNWPWMLAIVLAVVFGAYSVLV